MTDLLTLDEGKKKKKKIQPDRMRDRNVSLLCVGFKDVVSPEETFSSQSEHPDSEFEGIGDYEESILAEWWQEPKTKWDTGEVAD